MSESLAASGIAVPSAETSGATRDAMRGLALALPAMLWTLALFVVPSADRKSVV